jgi:hypothetical protein
VISYGHNELGAAASSEQAILGHPTSDMLVEMRKQFSTTSVLRHVAGRQLYHPIRAVLYKNVRTLRPTGHKILVRRTP